MPMPAFDSDQSRHTLNQQTDHSRVRDIPAHGAIALDPFSTPSLSAIPPLPSYIPTTKNRSTPPLTNKQTSSTSHSVGEINPYQDDDNSDPHDFYRTGSMSGPGQNTIRIEKRGDARGLQTHQQKPNNVSAPVNGPKVPTVASRISTRYASSPIQGSSPLSATKSNPGPLSTAQRRQTSVRELANRFNETADEVPPVPGTSASRSGSVSSNPGKSRASSRSRNIPELSARKGKAAGEVNSFKTMRSPRSPTSRPRREQIPDELISPKSAFYPEVHGLDQATRAPLASQSLTDLGNSTETSPRRPLFGEVFGVDPNTTNLGFGIGTTRQRRTSEGNMHSPNPMFSERAAGSRDESPSAWYKKDVHKVGDFGSQEYLLESAQNHRRARSDHESNSRPSHPPTSNMYGTDKIPPSSPSSASTSKRNSQSRIPISTHRRPSAASDSGNSTPSTRSNSAMEQMRSPARSQQPRTRAPPPRPLQRPRSPFRNSRSNTPSKSPRHVDHVAAARQEAKSPRLNAYISAPAAKKSPPLRSSRPRLPVSSASTSASRARAVERFSGDGSASKKESRTKKPKDLEGMDIDIAARRQAIQRSYTRKVGERERRNNEEMERKRASMLLESRALEKPLVSAVDGTTESKLEASQQANEEKLDREETQEAAASETAMKETPKPERELSINTGGLMDRSVLDLSMEDSPTLGTFGRFPRREGQGASTLLSEEVEPSSAITAGTSDSVDTFFDDEPQDDSLPSSRRASQDDAGFGHIDHLQISRSPSSRELHRDTAQDTVSEGDYRESIEIMLGETPVLPHGAFKDDQSRSKMKESTSSEDPDGRWSMTSFTSSNRSRDERDTPMERIDEHFPSQKQSDTTSSEQPAHLSVSTDSANDRTPQPWSPASSTSLKTTRTTLDSETYGHINRVLEHYHDPNLVSPDLAQDVQQQNLFNAQSPLLARQGGWDLQRMTHLVLQQAKERATQNNQHQPQNDAALSAPSNASKVYINKRSSSLGVPLSVPEKEVRDDMDEKIVQPAEHTRKESSSSFRSSIHYPEIDDGVERPARASLNRPEDWDMSPSLGGYDYQALDSPTVQEEKPLPPAKDWSSLQKQLQELPDPSNRRTPNVRSSHLRLPSIKGLEPIRNLEPEIRVDPPRSNDASIKLDVPPPPLPRDAQLPPPPLPPQPPAIPSSKSKTEKLQASSNDYGTVSFYQNRQVNGDHAVPLPSSTHAARPPPSLPSSMKPSNSSGVPSLSHEADTSVESVDKSVSPTPDQKRLTKRSNIIKELVDTEHSFCQDMKVVDDIYKGTSNVIISPEDMKILFGNTDQVVTFSTNFLDALKHGSKSVYVLAKSRRWNRNRISSNTTYSGTTTDDQSSISGPELSDDEKDRKTFIGESFGHKMTEMENVYSEYLKNHDAANQKLQVLQKNEKVVIWLKECQAYARDLTTAWNLDSLLVKPVQRILKYPLLLQELLDVTPENHPDYTALDVAVREMKGISMRINEMKKRADVMEQMNNKERKRKESDVRLGFAKTFGRRTEKLKQQVGRTEAIEDKEYAAVKHKFGEHFFQLQVVMRDTEMYCNDIQVFMSQFCEFAISMEAHIDVSQTSYPEVESKWRKFRMLTKEMSVTALPDHVAAIRKHVIGPMVQVLALHQQPEELMRKRDKKLTDYAKFKAIKDRGDKPDKKTTQSGEQFMAINDTLKDELPKLFDRTGKLLHACLNNFIHLQIAWQGLWRKKLRHALDLDDARFPHGSREIVDAFQSDFSFFEVQVNSLSACNGAMLNETANFLSPTGTLNGDGDIVSPGKAPSLGRRRTMSTGQDKSPMLPQPDFGERSSTDFFTAGDASLQTPGSEMHRQQSRRVRANSSLSGHSPRTPEIPGSYRTYSNSTTPVNSHSARPSTSTSRTYTEPPPLRPSFEVTSSNRYSNDSNSKSQRVSGATHPLPPTSQPRMSGDDTSTRYSGVFSSAMPMSDSPPNESPTNGSANSAGFNVIFLAASVYEFNIDRARREAGYPYLTYVAGEIFDVIGEKGELWLAKNQDDSTNEIGWIWNKHFVKLAQ